MEWSVSNPLRRVLVIDDQADVRTMVSIVLRISHFEVVEVASATARLNEFKNSNFDLAIVDIFLQESNGLDVIRRMRERIPGFPIVAISGMTTLDFVVEGPELFNVICLQKPFRPADLLRAIEAAATPQSPGAGDIRVAGSAVS
jgi:DNA-binding response OmpR family regulator